MSKVKVVRVIARLNIGGPAIHTILLSGSLNKRSYDDVLVCGQPGPSEGDMYCLASREKVNPVIVPSLGRDISFLRDLKAFAALYSIIRRERPAIVHTHTAKAGTLGRLAALCAFVPIKVHTFHGHIFDGYFNPVKARAFILIERILSLFTDKVIVVSESVKDDIVKRLRVVDGSKCVVVPLGLNLEGFLRCETKKGILRKSLGLAPDDFLIGIVGRLVPIKNHRMFLEAAKMIVSKKPDIKVKFLVIGDGELKEDLMAYSKRLDLENHVIFTGWVSDLESAYADLDIVALTSLNEGTPVSLIEAFASARPVVATNVGGIKDLVRDGENGFLTDANDAEGFSDKLLKLFDDSAMRTSFGSAGRRYVSQRHTRSRLVDDMEKLYGECLREKHLPKQGY